MMAGVSTFVKLLFSLATVAGGLSVVGYVVWSLYGA
jgi:phage shock protein PspC (stress-responsive transcriptional regulator)